MKDAKLHTGGAPDSASEYRIRELEARLDRRLVAVESRHSSPTWATRLMAGALIATLSALGAVVLKGMPTDGEWSATSLSTQSLVLRDSDGVQRGRLATDGDGRAQLSLSDQEGRERIRLTVLADGSPGVTISDPDAHPRAVLAYLPDGTTNLVFADAQGISRAVLGLEPDGSTQALFADPSGTIRTLVGVGADGVPSVSVYEDAGPRPSAP